MSVAYLQEVLDTVFDPPAPKDVDIDVPEDSAGMIALKRGKAMFEIMGIRTTDQWGMKAKFVKQGDNIGQVRKSYMLFMYQTGKVPFTILRILVGK